MRFVESMTYQYRISMHIAV